MAEIVKETVVTDESGPGTSVTRQSKVLASSSQTAEYVVYYVLGAIEVLLGFRLVLKLLGANPVSGFVNLVYSLSQIFVLPFEGIFRRAVTQGVETVAVLEPATIVAMVVYAVLAWGVVKLLHIVTGEHTQD